MDTIERLSEIRKEMHRDMTMRRLDVDKTRIIVGMGESGINAGARAVLKSILKYIDDNAIDDAVVILNNFNDQNNWAPVVWIERTGKPLSIFSNVEPDHIEDILDPVYNA
ncbi:hypothetical protein [Anaeropeptidivorans aminofermentans]|uniref:hypothetical protein n=1 Tax=Anaeropeptidivorans aminofermentans TaxID=2934315 RepID=UPI0020256C8B|nr:hypothetical protein [Anaeropeptidivorans aminofermentans]